MMSMIPDCQQTSDSVGWFAADDGGEEEGGGSLEAGTRVLSLTGLALLTLPVRKVRPR